MSTKSFIWLFLKLKLNVCTVVPTNIFSAPCVSVSRPVPKTAAQKKTKRQHAVYQRRVHD